MTTERNGRKNYWLSSMENIIWGLVFTGITINFMMLQYILPAIGVVMLLLGFKALRRKDVYFNLGYYLCIPIAALLFIRTVYLATIYSRMTAAVPLIVMNVIKTVLYSLLFFCMAQGIKALQRKNGHDKVSAGPVNGLTAFYPLSLGAGIFFEFADEKTAKLMPIASIILMIFYIVCLRKLWKMAAAMNESGIIVRKVPGLWHNYLTAFGYLGALLGCVLLCLRFCAAFPMKWEPETVNYQDEHEEIRENLLALGFPEEILADISEEDLLFFKDASRVETDWEYEIAESDVADESASKLKGTTIAVEVPSKQAENVRGWVILFHFLWEGEPECRFADSIEMVPLWERLTYREKFTEGVELTVSGRLLYDEGSVIYTAPYFSLGEDSFSDEEYVFDSIYGLFSFPDSGERFRGYMLYCAEDTSEEYTTLELSSFYVYKNDWTIYPMTIGSDEKMSNDGNSNGFAGSLFQYLLKLEQNN